MAVSVGFLLLGIAAMGGRLTLRPHRDVAGCYGPLNMRVSQKNAFLPDSSNVRLGLTIRIFFVLQARVSCQMNPFGSLILVSDSSPVTGLLNDSVWTSITPGTEKELFRPSSLYFISTNCG